MTEQQPVRSGLPPLPMRMLGLPIDHRGYPVPYFVAWIDGKPDHRIADAAKMPGAIRNSLCWMCGKQLGAYKSFCIGPMCCITRTIAEPPSHIDCLRFAAQACPWMTRPHAKRRDAGLPADVVDSAGFGIKRNPGVVCLWTTKKFRAYRNPGDQGNVGILFSLGEPESLEWYAEGRKATRAEVAESVRTGLPILEREAAADDAHNDALPVARLPFSPQRQTGAATAELTRRVAGFSALLDRWLA